MADDSPADAARGRISTSAAEVYEEFFVPALFAQWVEHTLDAADVREGDRLVDIGTGTGIVARAALRRVGSAGSVIAVDPNDGMLAVATRMAPELDVRQGIAERLPVEDSDTDCATCQFALMFFDDRTGAVKEMARVTRPGGRVVLATWAAVEESPGYAAMVDLLRVVIGDWAAEALRAPFTIGTPDKLAGLLGPTFPDVVVKRREGQARFTSLEQWLHTDIRGWTLAERVDDEQFQRLHDAAASRLAEFVSEDGRVTFAAPALFATATVT